MAEVKRRQFLILGASLLALSACVPDQPPPPKYTIKDLMSATPFYIAHRGSGDNWPEHTFAAYRRSALAGAKAIEVSVQATKDGVLVCHHDLTTARMTGVELDIAETNFSELEHLDNDAREWLGPNSLLVPIPLLKDVLDEHAANRVIFIEDKQGTNTEALLAMMDSYPESTEHFVWKQPASSMRFVTAKEHGYSSWGYFAPEDFDKISALAGSFDYLGIYHTAPDKTIQQLVATGKPVICWEIHTRSLRDKMSGLGVQGMMCSNYPYVTSARALSGHDHFSAGVRAAGDLPSVLAWSRQPLLIPGNSSVSFEQKEKSSYSMGSMCPVTESDYSINFHMAWAEKAPADFDHAGIAFGMENDAAYLVREASTVGGYHVVIRGSGSMELFSRQAGLVSGKLVRRVLTAPPVAGEWLQFRIRVSARTLTVERIDSSGWRLSVDDTQFRGGYISLCRNYEKGPTVQFRSVSISQD